MPRYRFPGVSTLFSIVSMCLLTALFAIAARGAWCQANVAPSNSHPTEPPPSSSPPKMPLPVKASDKRAPRLFLKIQEQTQLTLGKTPYRNVGVNIPDLFERFLHGDETSALTALMDARAAGVHIARCWGTTFEATKFGTFETDRARWLTAFDRMLDAADGSDIAVVPSLLFNIHMLPDYVRQRSGDSETLSQYLTPGTRSNDLALAYVTAIVSRYKDDSRVLFWEIGNEYNLEADLSTQVNGRAPGDVVTSDQVRAFLEQIAKRIHFLDKKHYVTSGNADMRPASYHLRAAMLANRNTLHALDFAPDDTPDTFTQYRDILAVFNPPSIDIISAHQYPPEPDTSGQNNGAAWLVEDGIHALRLPWTQYACASLNKPLFIGEVGQRAVVDGKEQSALWLRDFLRRAQTSAAPIAALRAWEFGANDPMQSPFSLSPTRAPQLTQDLLTTNAAILNASVTGAIIVRPPPFDAAKTTQQQDAMTAQNAKLRAIAVEVLNGAGATISRQAGGESIQNPKSKIQNLEALSFAVHLADGRQADKTFHIRDAALMLGADLIAPEEVAGWVRLIAANQAGTDGLRLANGLSVPPYSIPDHITLAGEPIWFPGANAGSDQGNGSFGYLPPADNPFWFIQMVYEHLRLTGKPALFQSQILTPWGKTTIAEVCVRAFDSIDVDANGLVVVGNGQTDWRVDWGYTDTVRKSGACLMPSLLRWRAAKDLVRLFAAIGDRAQIVKYEKIVTDTPVAIANTFYHPLDKENGKEVGLLYSATGLGRKDDLWASAYAVAISAVRSRVADPVAQHLRLVYQAGSSVTEGYVRPIPSAGPNGGFWEQTTTPPNTYQNGAFWGFPAGWYIAALMRVDPPTAGQMLNEFIASLETRRKDGAPWQCLAPPNKYTRLPDYCASVTAPYAALFSALAPR